MPSLATRATGNGSVESPPLLVFAAAEGGEGGTGVKGSEWGVAKGAGRKEPGRRGLVGSQKLSPASLKRKHRELGVLPTLQGRATEVLQAF